jgi:hypothetical protein
MQKENRTDYAPPTLFLHGCVVQKTLGNAFTQIEGVRTWYGKPADAVG